MATCNICRAQYTWGRSPCWRCGADNTYWEHQRTLPRSQRITEFFGNIWGIMAVVLNIFPLSQMIWIVAQSIIWADYEGFDLYSQRGEFLGQFLAWFLSFICILFIYALRFELWHYSWIRNIRFQKTPSLSMGAVILFLLGVATLMLYLTLEMFWHPVLTPRTTGLDFSGIFQKIVMPGIYSLIFVFLCTANMLMSAVLYIARLNEYVSQPLYMNTNLLVEVVQRAAAETLEFDLQSTRVSNIKRTPGGGVAVILNHLKADTDAPPDDLDSAADRRYEIEANEWGQILTMIERPLTARL
mgnify:CR=1 FL=1